MGSPATDDKVVAIGTESTGSRSPAESSQVSLDSGDESLVEGNFGSQGGHVFEDEKKAAYWRAVYEKANYESLHRFDPNFKWSAKEEKALVWKVCAKPAGRMIQHVLTYTSG